MSISDKLQNRFYIAGSEGLDEKGRNFVDGERNQVKADLGSEQLLLYIFCFQQLPPFIKLFEILLQGFLQPVELF